MEEKITNKQNPKTRKKRKKSSNFAHTRTFKAQYTMWHEKKGTTENLVLRACPKFISTPKSNKFNNNNYITGAL